MKALSRSASLFLSAVATGCAAPVAAAPVAIASSDSPAASVATPETTGTRAPRPDNAMFLGSFPVETSTLLGADELLLRTRYVGAALGELEARQLLLRRNGGELLLRASSSYPSAEAAVSEQERTCSFLLDCDDQAVQALVAELRSKNRTSPSDVVDYVHGFVSTKGLSRPFDIASVVARSRTGDCTEHAVLTAALLRGVGIPGRVLVGVVVPVVDGRSLAFGHAWAEYHDGMRWQLADATKLEVAEPIVYVPLQALRNEGPGFAQGMFSGLQLVDVEGVVVSQF